MKTYNEYDDEKPPCRNDDGKLKALYQTLN